MFLIRRPRVTQPPAGEPPVQRLSAPGAMFGVGYAVPVGGTLSNSTQPILAASGIGGYAWESDGSSTNGSIVTANSTVSTTSFSLLAIVQFDTSAAIQSFLDRDINTRRSFQLRRTTSQTIELIRFNTAASSVVSALTTGTVPVGIPTAIVAVVRGLNHAIYLGKETARAAITGTPQTFDGVLGLCSSWGGTAGTSGYPASLRLDGKLYDYAALPYALSEDEAQAMAQSPDAMRTRLYGPRRIWVPVSASGVVSHTSTGALVAGAAVVAGTATDVATYTATGALSAAAAVIAGTATHLTLHGSTGALAAGAAVVVGSANHINVHGSTGALVASAATVAGSAQHTAPGSFSSTGALAASAAVVAGTATHLTLHTSTGVLAAGAALVAGVAVHSGPGSVVDAPRRQAAGRASKRKRDKLVVAIDGQDVIVSSVEEAEELIDKVLEDAKVKAELAQSRANASKRRPVSKVMYDARKTLALPEIEAPPELEAYADKVLSDIRELFTEQLRSIEITALLAKRQRQEEDDEDVLLLIA